MKGGVMLLGVTADGRRGPFCVRGQDEEEQENERPEQVLPTSVRPDGYVAAAQAAGAADPGALRRGADPLVRASGGGRPHLV
jgi:hypothetical protein